MARGHRSLSRQRSRENSARWIQKRHRAQRARPHRERSTAQLWRYHLSSSARSQGGVTQRPTKRKDRDPRTVIEQTPDAAGTLRRYRRGTFLLGESNKRVCDRVANSTHRGTTEVVDGDGAPVLAH